MKRIQNSMRKWAISIFFVALCIASFTACNKKEMVSYYSDESKYITATGIVSHVAYSTHTEAWYLCFSDLSYHFDDNCFKIVGGNIPIVQEKIGHLDTLYGKTVTFITAPKYFGDGYVMPIVSLVVDDETILNYQEGFKYFLEWLKTD